MKKLIITGIGIGIGVNLVQIALTLVGGLVGYNILKNQNQ